MTAFVTPTEDQVFQAIVGFISSVMPAGVEVRRGQFSRVPQPAGLDFIVVTQMAKVRIETNVDQYVDCKFQASINGTVMTVSAVDIGEIGPSTQVFGTGVSPGTVITSLGTGSGGVGTYNVAPAQQAPSQVMSSGVNQALQPVNEEFQIDVYGPNSGDNSHVLTTLLRDEFAVDQFAGTFVTPLHADDPRQMPLLDAEQQYEARWTVEAHFQVNQTVTVPQQFADTVSVTLVEVDTTFPP